MVFKKKKEKRAEKPSCRSSMFDSAAAAQVNAMVSGSRIRELELEAKTEEKKKSIMKKLGNNAKFKSKWKEVCGEVS